MCPWTKGCCHSLHVVVKLFPTQFTSLFSYCFINVLGDCFPPSMWGLMAGLLVFVRQESGLPLGAGFQQWKLLDVLALNFHFGRQFFNGFSVLFCRPAREAYCVQYFRTMNTLVPLDEVFHEFDLSSPFTITCTCPWQFIHSLYE